MTEEGVEPQEIQDARLEQEHHHEVLSPKILKLGPVDGGGFMSLLWNLPLGVGKKAIPYTEPYLAFEPERSLVSSNGVPLFPNREAHGPDFNIGEGEFELLVEWLKDLAERGIPAGLESLVIHPFALCEPARDCNSIEFSRERLDILNGLAMQISQRLMRQFTICLENIPYEFYHPQARGRGEEYPHPLPVEMWDPIALANLLEAGRYNNLRLTLDTAHLAAAVFFNSLHFYNEYRFAGPDSQVVYRIISSDELKNWVGVVHLSNFNTGPFKSHRKDGLRRPSHHPDLNPIWGTARTWIGDHRWGGMLDMRHTRAMIKGRFSEVPEVIEVSAIGLPGYLARDLIPRLLGDVWTRLEEHFGPPVTPNPRS